MNSMISMIKLQKSSKSIAQNFRKSYQSQALRVHLELFMKQYSDSINEAYTQERSAGQQRQALRIQQVVHPGSEMRVTPTKTSEILYHVG